jgi:hypothetical protein
MFPSSALHRRTFGLSLLEPDVALGLRTCDNVLGSTIFSPCPNDNVPDYFSCFYHL